ncbi:MAG: YhjD/YihY/BrkB family envelope integrity protein, partial [Bacteroidota bacterium]
MVNSRPVNFLLTQSKRIALPGFDGVPIYDVGDFFFTGIQIGSVVMRAQSLAFSFFLAIFPAIIFLFSLIAYVPISGMQSDVMTLIRDILPNEAYKWA